METIDGGTTSSDGAFLNSELYNWTNFFLYLLYFLFVTADGCDADGYHKNKAKRVRTTFTEEQLQVLQANFQLDSNPDGQDLERIASVTGLSKRVTQVWFQNSRARQKKHIHAGKNKSRFKLDVDVSMMNECLDDTWMDVKWLCDELSKFF